MRILSGQSKGRTLKTREGKGARPTDSRSREMLFNVLGERVVGARVLDLYAGTGSVGLEALSRGALSCVFIEQNAGACAVLRQNIKLCGVGEESQVWQSSVASGLRQLSHQEARFDIVFADPPFTREGELEDLCKRLEAAANVFEAPVRLDTSGGLLHNAEGQTERRCALLVIQHHHKARPVFGATLEVSSAAPDRQQSVARFELVKEKRAGESGLSFFAVSFP